MAGELTDAIINELAENVSSANMESIAMGFMDIDAEAIELLKENSNKAQKTTSLILRKWRDKVGGKNQIGKLAVILYKSAEAHSYINPNKVERILGISREQADAFEKTLDEPAGTGTGTGPTPTPPKDTGAARTGQSGKKLTDEMISKLAKEIIEEDDLMTIGIDGLKMKRSAVKKQINNNRSITMAANNVLTAWVNSKESRVDAYTVLCDALRATDNGGLIKEME